MKKILALIAAFVLVLSLAACSTPDCDMCGREGIGENEIEQNGATANVCDDCKKITDIFTR